MIKYKNLFKSFGQTRVLNGISFEVKKGKIVFILGTSGTGKSVLLKNTVGLMKPDSGEIWVDDTEVSSLSERELFKIRKRCGMVFQHPALFDSLTIFDNVAFGLRKHFDLSEEAIKKKVHHFLSLMNLSGIDHKMPSDISYGMQKRVSLARTVALEPDVLLFDEPTTGLDPITTNAINRLIEELSRKLNTTSLVVSHDMKCALDIADHIVVLDKGQIVGQGSPDELIKHEHPLIQDFLKETE